MTDKFIDSVLFGQDSSFWRIQNIVRAQIIIIQLS